MAGFRFRIDGVDRLSKKLDAAPKKIVSEVKGELEAGAKKIERAAIQDVPVDTGRLKNAIRSFQVGPLTFEVVAQTNYAAFVEFGTGGLVNVPAGLEEYAMQFKGRGLKVVNMPARPFLFNNYLIERVNIVKRVKAVIADLK